ncbi:hypothetical protein TanjilG_18699 [Lupinus angustifolius]|uniref:Uncharacterized protein n=1 Tax=Lupinus angustifolius TaxID=3871 RepID=A0A1J7FVY8_LUPAN|nr:hypothetical protein TanjilG_18699 [Lupinus angustifolius]
MPRYEDRYGNTRLYVGRLSSRTRSRDLERVFNRYGRVRYVDVKNDYAFVEFSDHRDADEAIYQLDGHDVDGSRLIVEFAKGVPRGSQVPHGSREYLGWGPAPGSGCCFNCGLGGHWARDCKAGDWKNKCYRCGERDVKGIIHAHPSGHVLLVVVEAGIEDTVETAATGWPDGKMGLTTAMVLERRVEALRAHENDSRSPRDDDCSPRDDDRSRSPRDDDRSPRDDDHGPRDDDDNHHGSPKGSRTP